MAPCPFQTWRRLNNVLLPDSIDQVKLNEATGTFQKRQFVSHRAVLDYISLLVFYNRSIMWLFWESPLAKPLHHTLFAVWRNPLIYRLLYGEAGSPPDPKQHEGEHSH